jgi:hypothetical protein
MKLLIIGFLTLFTLSAGAQSVKPGGPMQEDFKKMPIEELEQKILILAQSQRLSCTGKNKPIKNMEKLYDFFKSSNPEALKVAIDEMEEIKNDKGDKEKCDEDEKKSSNKNPVLCMLSGDMRPMISAYIKNPEANKQLATIQDMDSNKSKVILDFFDVLVNGSKEE